MVKLGVNIDHVATLRQARQGVNPEPVQAAFFCEAAGADSIVVHLREDRRHIQDNDVFLLRQSIKTRLNLEMSLSEEIVKIACMIKPDQATLVPEKRKELTTEGGLDVAANFSKIRHARQIMQKQGIEVSLFIDPDKQQIEAAKKTGVKMVELHTGRYADSKTEALQEKYFKQLVAAAGYARKIGLHVFAGHGLDYNNASRIAAIKGIEELNIGYSIICRGVFAGLSQAVKEMKALIN